MIKKFLFVAALGFLVSACGDGYNLTPDELIKANNGGMSYAMNEGGKFLQCSGLDSNSDNYVTCSFTPKDGGPTKEILCAYSSVGCKQK